MRPLVARKGVQAHAAKQAGRGKNEVHKRLAAKLSPAFCVIFPRLNSESHDRVPAMAPSRSSWRKLAQTILTQNDKLSYCPQIETSGHAIVEGLLQGSP